MKLNFGYCPKCRELKQLTRHHIMPSQWYKREKLKPICHLCRDCHDDIEVIIRDREKGKKLTKKVYLEILLSFLEG